MSTEKEPLILVFYIYRDVLANKDIRESYFESVKKHFEDIKLKATFFFLPTDTEERIDCINPRFIEDQDEITKLKNILEDVQKRFDVGTSVDQEDDDSPSNDGVLN
jgi:hypothetical protein